MSAGPFSREMRIVTRKIHKLSDSLVNAKVLFGKSLKSYVTIVCGTIFYSYLPTSALSDPLVWLDGLLCFHPIFHYLESNIGKNELPASFHRAAAIECDIRYYCKQLGLDADKQLSEQRPSVVAYLEHLAAVKAENPVLLMAYAYHLYMGMLSGGQILNKKRRMFAKLSLAETDADDVNGDGYRTTAFDELNGETVAELKAQMRQAADALGDRVDAATRQRLLDESVMVFELNNAMVHSIRGGGKVALRKVSVAIGVIALAVVAFRLLRW